MEIVANGLAFPEGPVIMSDGSVIVVELAAGRITRCWNGRSECIAEVGGGPNGAAIGPDGALWICNSGGIDLARMQNARGPGCEGRIERLDLATGRVERVYDTCEGIPLEAPNDLVFDADGRLWFTDLGKTHDGIRTASGLFSCLADGNEIEAVNRHAVSYNGVGLSPDGSAVYVADTHQARLWRYDRKPGPQRPVWIATAPGPSGFDSLAVTAAGNICVATLHTGGITTVTPSGETRHRPFDDPYVTNIAFGGADMQDAWITLSSRGLLAKVRWDEPGLKLHFNA
ncbi:SMP-30/gluconolactonase/LRE family protein [Novosphingobium sp. KCTC 2891]|uniref:SMP-30/gluconolactonase/LRE family protein n=1 Tax=Novosphingobium sp. KCTC 2891 TaxID=2989730 RepID=UPI002221964A|nr:SMP-30/gluconolactonase/LRE family protein [Novosphingobium sp. KCTC 2891]MCW1383658.1 SMP-30/gluconolactonase/LRE family protein [Novosphingobium sp. KCTC 2891]